MPSLPEGIKKVLANNPHASHEEIANELNTKHGYRTTGASVASTRSRMKSSNGNGNGNGNGIKSSSIDELQWGIDEEPAQVETEEERSARIRNRYSTLERMTDRIIDGKIPSMIVSGPPGLGKSYTIETGVRERLPIEKYKILSGTIAAPGLYIALYNMKDNGIVVLDDCDSVFRNEDCLNILKAVLDSSSVRTVSYMKEAHFLVEYDIPNQFEFNGTVVFCTNLDFESAIAKNNQMAPHFQALIDRSLYLSLGMRSIDDYLVRLYQVGIEDKLLEGLGLKPKQAMEVFKFIEMNTEGFYTVSLRLLLQVAQCYLLEPDFWKLDVQATKMRASHALRELEDKE